MKKITLEIPEYDPVKGKFTFNWQDDAKIKVIIDGNSVLLEANKNGLLSLANHLVNLAQNNVPNFEHFHLDQFNGLEEGSCEIIITQDLED